MVRGRGRGRGRATATVTARGRGRDRAHLVPVEEHDVQQRAPPTERHLLRLAPRGAESLQLGRRAPHVLAPG